MTNPIKKTIRPLLLPFLHYWQRFYDFSRGKLQERRDCRRAVRDGAIVAKDIYGTRFVLYPFDRPNLAALVRHPHDAAEFRAIRSLVSAGDVAFDVGANIGIYSVLLSRLCGSTGRVWAHEPVPDTYWRLRETLALNRCENVTPVQSAVCDKTGVVRMNLFGPQFAEWNTLGMPKMTSPEGKLVSPSQSLEVPSCTLDEFCDTERIEHINFLKVDVEGFELSVFRGAERLLQERRVDYICFEISQEPLKGAGVEGSKVFEALAARGYLAYRFESSTGTFGGPVRDTAESWTNFFASWKDLSRIKEAKDNDSFSTRHEAVTRGGAE